MIVLEWLFLTIAPVETGPFPVINTPFFYWFELHHQLISLSTSLFVHLWLTLNRWKCLYFFPGTTPHFGGVSPPFIILFFFN